MQTESSAECLFQLLKQLQVPVTRRGVYDQLVKHPDYPSLLACSDVLHNWGVPNGVYKIDSEELGAVPTPLMAQMTTQGAEFRLIEKVETAHIINASHPQRAKESTYAEFEQHFSGNVLIAEPQSGSGEPHYSQNRRKERIEALRIPFVITGGLFLVGLILSQSAWLATDNWHTALLLFIKSTGLVLAILLLGQSLGLNNPMLQRICEGGSNSSCSAILASPAAKLMEEISWAEVGVAYFAGTWLAIVVLAGFPGIRMVLALVSLLSLPFTLYLLYYQARVARQWCVLCCAVQAILWLEFLASAAYITPMVTWPSFTEWATLLGCLLAPTLGWIIVKPYFAKEQQAIGLRGQLLAFKRDQHLFESALANQPRYPLLSESDAIRLGNPTAQQIITVVSNPTCLPCVRAHELLEQWLTWRDDVQVQIVFDTPDDLQAISQQVASHLLVLNQQHPDTVRAALHSWYTEGYREYGPWANRYPIDSAALATTSLHMHHSWCQQAAVTVTPTVLLNGHSLPVHYELEDIQYFL